MQEKAPDPEEACTVSAPLAAKETLACWANRHAPVVPVVYVEALLTSVQVEAPAS
jgi:hypothetical protein